MPCAIGICELSRRETIRFCQEFACDGHFGSRLSLYQLRRCQASVAAQLVEGSRLLA